MLHVTYFIFANFFLIIGTVSLHDSFLHHKGQINSWRSYYYYFLFAAFTLIYVYYTCFCLLYCVVYQI